MEYSLKSADASKISCDCLITFALGSQLSSEANQLDITIGGELADLLKISGLESKSSGTAMLYKSSQISAKMVMLVQLGNLAELTLKSINQKFSNAINQAKTKPIKSICLCLKSVIPDHIEHADFYQLVSRTCENTCYHYNATKKSNKQTSKMTKIFLVVDSKSQTSVRKAIKLGVAISHGESLSKELADLPANICTPSYLADQAKLLSKETKLKVKVLDEKDMNKLGMDSLLSVSRGSDEPAKFIIFEYSGSKHKNAAPVVLVGKGLTFDSGGISIKPAAKMDEMKYDMCGGASVFGTMKAVCEMTLPINVIGVVPSSENMINGKANKPGDVVTSMSGQTIEILNTDAEGRLILCDALTYVERYKPAMVVDIATLTGAVIVALGDKATGLMANDQALANTISEAGDKCGDRVWQLPIWDDYQAQLNSNFADIANVGGRSAGTITAACFLSRFAKKFKWAHLDIAGTAWIGGGSKGATGRPVPLLCQILINHSQSI